MDFSTFTPSKTPESWQYHPLELVVRPTSLESDLALRIAQGFGREFRVGFVRHGAGVVAQASLETRLTFGEEGPVAGLALNGRDSLFMASGHLDLPMERSLLSDMDLVIVEGCVDSRSPTVLELSPDGSGLHKALLSGAKHLVALVGERRPVDKLPPGGIPWFHPDDLPGLLEHLRDLFGAVLRSRPLWAILLRDGSSEPSRVHQAVAVLSSRCVRVFADLSNVSESPSVEPLASLHPRLGELGHILSALETYPGVAFLVAKPDSDGLEMRIDELIRRRDPYRMATAFRESDTHLPASAPAIWEPKALSRIHLALAARIRCPQRILTHSRLELLDPYTA